MPIFYAIVVLIVAGPMISYFFKKGQKEINNRLISFIAENYERLANGLTIDYNGTLINVDSKLTRYRYCYSFIIMTNNAGSAYFLADNVENPEAKKAKAICQLITVLSGWWGIPWGIINSIQYLISNATENGTNDETVGGLMAKMSANNAK